MPRESVLVVGCGVIGLASALELQRAGFSVRIAARALPPDTVSNVAAALWYPYAVSPRERCDAWAMASYEVFREEARDGHSGVLMRRGIELFTPDCAPQGLALRLQGTRAARADELRPGYSAGVVFDAPVIETPIYLDHLMHRFREGGGRIDVREFAALDEAFELEPVVVNCSGLGARELARDASVFAIRGQILRVERGAVERFAIDHDASGGTTYVIPRSRDCVLGGTREERREDLDPDPRQTADIRRRASALVEAVAHASQVGTAVGLRPGRPAVRLEVEERARGRVVHNYGHGGGGVTLSWGCAREVRELLSR